MVVRHHSTGCATEHECIERKVKYKRNDKSAKEKAAPVWLVALSTDHLKWMKVVKEGDTEQRTPCCLQEDQPTTAELIS